MRKLAKSLLVILPAFLAGYLAWLFLPCQPERSALVPAGTKLLEFSRTGRYVVTCRDDQSWCWFLTLWNTDTGQAAYETQISCEDVLTSYGFSADDRWLALATGSSGRPHLVIVDLISSNAVTPIAALRPKEELPLVYLGQDGPNPAFSSDGRYLSYLTVDDDDKWCAVVYDIAEKREQLRVPDAYDSLGPPTRHGKWLVVRESKIEVWDVAQRRREAVLSSWTLEWKSPWTQGWKMNGFQSENSVNLSFTPDEQAVRALCFVRSQSRQEQVFLRRGDLNTRKIETEWEHVLPPVERPLWDTESSVPLQFLLIKTLDDDGHLVEDLLDLATGKVLARYPEPIDMLEGPNLGVWKPVFGPSGLTHSLGRTGQMGIDAEGRVIVSKQISRESSFWQYFGTPLGWLGIRPGPPQLCLQFHSAETGRLLKRVFLQTSDFSRWGEPTLALHPSQPLLAVVDEQGPNSRLQFWRVPPPRPWAWIAACGLAAAGFASLIRFGYSKLRKRKAIGQANSA